ncbi:unnamed protein product [Bubo scandiacus]
MLSGAISCCMQKHYGSEASFLLQSCTDWLQSCRACILRGFLVEGSWSQVCDPITTAFNFVLLFQAKLFILLSVICVLLNMTGFISGCEGIQFVSRSPRCDLVDMGESKACFCCEEFQLTGHTEETERKLCSAAHFLKKKTLFALCALNALTTTVCLGVTALHHTQFFATRVLCIDECQLEDKDYFLDPDDFVPLVPPPSYFATSRSCIPCLRCRTLDYELFLLPCIDKMQDKGIEVLCPVDPPPL